MKIGNAFCGGSGGWACALTMANFTLKNGSITFFFYLHMIGEERDRPVVLETVDSGKIGADVRRGEGGYGILGLSSSYHITSIFIKNRIIFFYSGLIYGFFLHFIQHCFICRPSDSTVSEDAEIEPRTFATTALAVRRSNH